MNIKAIIILTTCMLSAAFHSLEAKTPNRHAAAHKQQLAAAKNTRLDKNTINRLVEEDIAMRENANHLTRRPMNFSTIF